MVLIRIKTMKENNQDFVNIVNLFYCTSPLYGSISKNCKRTEFWKKKS